MAETYTSNLELVKPDYNSPADIFVINSNMDKIDNAVANAGKVKSVNGKTGDVSLSASDVGALPSGGTAVNATQLNGKDAEEYALLTEFSKRFPRFRNFDIRTDDTATPIDTVMQDHWNEIEDWSQFFAFIENASGAYTNAIGFKIGGGYGAYISISYNQNPMYYRLFGGTWSETALA